MLNAQLNSKSIEYVHIEPVRKHFQKVVKKNH